MGPHVTCEKGIYWLIQHPFNESIKRTSYEFQNLQFPGQTQLQRKGRVTNIRWKKNKIVCVALKDKTRNIIMFVSHNAYGIRRNTSFKQDWAWGRSTKCGHLVEFRIGVGWITGKLFLYGGDGSSLWTWGWVREWVGVATINKRKISTARMLTKCWDFSKSSDAKNTHSNVPASRAGDMLVTRIQEAGRRPRREK